ncbi:hypothetical protein HAP41_0000013290 [Bradyrhizobium barranii subsp. apii]|uniref:DUF4238 domain-containing protein n=1 Tax=Bradyrhizobium barranii subsp. apii TaxID=2819348 RepID=A0A8U0FT18_9BRAD|nr:hypothetical protein [Bradyrhizobium barranii]UPT89848.1 hypothetical protein HAP41_0000013290 [Bradyrhizobium barranii subsp. apii]
MIPSAAKTRNNHYVPQWHQEGFFEERRNVLAYLDLTPDEKVLADGRTITFNAFEHRPTSLAQLTGSSIFTDSAYRWREIRGAIASKEARLAKLSSNFKSTTFQMPTTVVDAVNSIVKELPQPIRP